MKTAFCLLGLLLTIGSAHAADETGSRCFGTGARRHFVQAPALVWTPQERREIERSQRMPAPNSADERRVAEWAKAHKERAIMYQRARAGSWERFIPYGGASLNVKSLCR